MEAHAAFIPAVAGAANWCGGIREKLSPRRPAGRDTAGAEKSAARRQTRCCVERPSWKKGPVDVDFAKDEQLEILEEELTVALEGEDFKHASTIRDKLRRLQSGAYVAVLSANLKYYKAFNNQSVIDMAGCWLQDKSVVCKHPLGDPAVGYLEVINSFGFLFALGAPALQNRNLRILMRGSVAYVTCDEVAMDEDSNEVVMCATNIFVKWNGQWYLSHHSSMPLVASRL